MVVTKLTWHFGTKHLPNNNKTDKARHQSSKTFVLSFIRT